MDVQLGDPQEMVQHGVRGLADRFLLDRRCGQDARVPEESSGAWAPRGKVMMLLDAATKRTQIRGGYARLRGRDMERCRREGKHASPGAGPSRTERGITAASRGR